MAGLTANFADIMHTTAAEMAGSIFDQERRDRLKEKIATRYEGSKGKSDKRSLALSGALMALLSSTPADENHFLTMPCLYSMMDAIQKSLHGSRKP
jgi:hypothetical protein